MSLPTASTPGYGEFRGRVACDCLIKWLPVYEAELKRRGVIKYSIDIYQLTGGNPKSGGTHIQGGAYDIAQTSPTAVWVARQMGADATWHRPYNWDNAGGGSHTHGVLRGCPHNSPARYQITSSNYGVDTGHNGLANGGSDNGPRPLSKRTWTQGITWAKAQQPPPTTTYYVKGPFALGHQDPTARSRRIGSSKVWGTALKILKTTTVDGALWGWVDGSTIEGRWYLMSNLSKTKPTSKIEKIGEIGVGTYNVAAQAKGHADTYPVRAPLSAKNMADTHVAGIDVWGVQEYGSGTTVNTATGKTYLQLSDLARYAANPKFVRYPHGAKWRYLLGFTDTVQYAENTGKSVTLPTRVDTDGTQITLAGVWKNDVRHLLVTVHFDVNSTTAQLAAQARETLAVVDQHRREVFPAAWWNTIITGDFNDTGTTVASVFAKWGLVPLASDALDTLDADKRTTNSWTNTLTVGPRRDDIYVSEGSGIKWRRGLDGVASDHDEQHGTRASYGTLV